MRLLLAGLLVATSYAANSCGANPASFTVGQYCDPTVQPYDCARGLTCLSDGPGFHGGECTLFCTVDRDCPGFGQCVSGFCQAICTAESNCAVGTTCRGSLAEAFCVPDCRYAPAFCGPRPCQGDGSCG